MKIDFSLMVIALYLTAMIAGFIGSILGLGGGVIMVPMLDLLLGFDIKEAAASSIIAVVGTSMMSSSTYIDKRLARTDIALYLILPSLLGSFVGMYTVIALPSSVVRILFGIILFYSLYYLNKKRELAEADAGAKFDDPLNENLYSYYDEALGRNVQYEQKSLKFALFLMFLSGFTASMFGVGGGIVNVPVLALVVGLPIKIAVATSTVIILFTATTSSILQLTYGYSVPWAAGILFVGTVIGSRVGSKIMNRLQSKVIRYSIMAAIFYTGVRMILKGLGFNLPI